MHIGFIHPFMFAGGAQRVIVELAKQFSKKGHNVTLFTGKIDLSISYFRDLNKRNIRIIETGYRYNVSRFLEKLSTLLPMANALKRYNVDDIDVFNPHNWPSYISAYLFKRKLGAFKPFVWTCNEPTHFWLVNRFFRLPTTFIEKQAIKGMDEVLVLSMFMRDMLMREYGVSSIVVNEGVDPDFFSPRCSTEIVDQYGLNTDSLKILTVVKNIFFTMEVLKHSLSRRRDITLFVLGNVSRSMQLKIKSSSIGKHIEILGYIDESILPYVYSTSDLFVFANPHEPWGLVVLESMACGTPVLAFDSGGPKDMVMSGKTGCLAKTKNEFVDFICSYDNETARNMGRASRKFVCENFTWDKISDKYLALFKRLLDEKSPEIETSFNK